MEIEISNWTQKHPTRFLQVDEKQPKPNLIPGDLARRFDRHDQFFESGRSYFVHRVPIDRQVQLVDRDNWATF
jgi:hypothetical protein